MNRNLREAVVGWDTVNWSSAVDFWEERLPSDLGGTQALEVGCGGGGLSLWLAGKHSQVICSDFTNPMERVRPLHRLWGVHQQITYEPIDALDIPYVERFDIVAIKSVLASIGKNGNVAAIKDAVQQMRRALKPGGRLLFAENLDTSFHRFFRRHFVAWGKNCHYFECRDLIGMLSCFKTIEYKSCGFLGAFGRSNGQRVLLGTLDRFLMNRMVGPQNHYIVFGVATK